MSAVKRPIPKDAAYRQLHTCCGKGACRACGGVRYVHGPYWFAEWTVVEKGKRKTRTRYVGKVLPLVRMGWCSPCECARCA